MNVSSTKYTRQLNLNLYNILPFLIHCNNKRFETATHIYWKQTDGGKVT